MAIQIITPTEIKDLVVTDISFDESYFDKYIDLAQLKYVKAALGKELYEDYLAQFGALPPEYQTLKDEYIDRMLAFFVVYEAFPEIRDKLTNQGVMHNGTEFSDQTPSFDYAALRSTYNHNGNFWQAELIEYLIDNGDTYPLFSSCPDDVKTSNNKGFYLY